MAETRSGSGAGAAGAGKSRILIVDDDREFGDSMAEAVEADGFATQRAESLEGARERLADSQPDVVLVDLELPDGLGTELLRENRLSSDTLFVVITGHASVETAVEAMRDGALDYLTKPFDRSRLRSVLSKVARTLELKRQVQALRGELREVGRFGPLVGRSQPMQEVYNLISRVAPTSAAVLIAGESGTGKELVAQTIHSLSARSEEPMFAVNCGAVSANLIETELFGHEKGSFTGAGRQRSGYLEQADGGTIFLDEITEMPAALQVKLLRVLETGVYRRVGGNESLKTDVRVLAATNRNPAQAVSEGRLREDLFYRLNVFPIVVPALRERGDDVDLLAHYFLEELNRIEGRAKGWTPEALHEIRSRPWPGNVRELRNAVQRAFILADREIDAEQIRALDLPLCHEPASSDADVLRVPVATEIAAVEKKLILATLAHFDGDKKEAARSLGISLKTLYNRLNVYRADAGERAA